MEEKVAGKRKIQASPVFVHTEPESFTENIFSCRSHQDANSTLTAIFQDGHTKVRF